MSTGESAELHEPTMGPIKYVFIPVEETREPKELLFAGGSDEEFRGSITQYFRQKLLSQEQKNEMTKHLVQKASESGNRGDDTAPPQVSAQQQNELISEYLEQTSFEIVPIVMPARDNKFVGTSLYIDDSGRFKDLPLNCRASKIAQRDIRGDAFLLSNHDDPALDEWGRVDCSLSTYNELLANPPTTKYDASDRAQMASLTMQRESETKCISEGDVSKAKEAKEAGNKFFTEGDIKAAVQAYSECADLTEGRRDLLPNESEVTSLRVSALLNRSLCLYRMGKNDDAAHDARAVLQINAKNLKAHHHLTKALCGSRDYDEAAKSLEAYEKLGGQPQDIAQIRQSIVEGKKRLMQEEKNKYAKMFAST
ncbi:hypothetical protein DPX39_110070400 [Trypanosoma brucei equiperdum]|uniref:TPR repeat n=1 Tax=Trypanosoma brucei equiperdum TaxID=630700 RepID=A0A3L6KUB0_9TRYP|nr:hypothetical protein DPX39_110070400 [Trypanosoma brucei equiperdum]